MTATVSARGRSRSSLSSTQLSYSTSRWPDGKPRVALTIRLPHGTIAGDLATKSVRRAIAAVRGHEPEAVAAFVQGRLVDSEITEAGRSSRRCRSRRRLEAPAA